MSYLLFIFKSVCYWLDPEYGIFIPTHDLLYLLLYTFYRCWVFVLVKTQNLLVCMVTNFIFAEFLNHYSQDIVDCTFFMFKAWHCMNYHFLKIFATLRFFWAQQKLIGVPHGFKILAETLSNLTYETRCVVLNSIYLLYCVSNILFRTSVFR